MPAALGEVLAADYLGDLTGRALPDLRARRAECNEVETGLSLLRRLVQGHLDIAGAELERRAGGAAPRDLAEVVAALPDLLADRTRAPGVGRLSPLLAPEALDPGLEAELVALVGTGPAVDPTAWADDDLRRLVEGLTALEATVSAHRRDLFARIDAIQEEIARRYKAGEATIDSLLGR